MNDFMYLSIPAFHVKYKRWKKYGAVREVEKNNSQEALCEASGGYCMYCYIRIKTDNKLCGQLEHAIEKDISKKLIECVPDFGLACPVCNQSFKKVGQKKRKVPEAKKILFEQKSKCSVTKRKQCTVPCQALRRLQQCYSAMPEAEIILQPMGIQGRDSGNPLAVRYDVMKMEFQPDTGQYEYSENELAFIQKHIQRFHLNDPKYRTSQLADYIKCIIDSGGVLPEYEYNNLVVQLFANCLAGKTTGEKLNICKRLYVVIFLRT